MVLPGAQIPSVLGSVLPLCVIPAREEAQGYGGWRFGVRSGFWPFWVLCVGGVGVPEVWFG